MLIVYTHINVPWISFHFLKIFYNAEEQWHSGWVLKGVERRNLE